MKSPRSSEDVSTKKVYTPPRLEIFGSLRSITETTGTPPHPFETSNHPPYSRT